MAEDAPEDAAGAEACALLCRVHAAAPSPATAADFSRALGNASITERTAGRFEAALRRRLGRLDPAAMEAE